jgi:hypothetical protein
MFQEVHGGSSVMDPGFITVFIKDFPLVYVAQ